MSVTQEEYLEELRSGARMKFEDLIALIDDDYDYTPASFTNGEANNAADENQGSAKLFCFAAIHQYYQDVLNTPESDSHANIRNFMTYGWEGLKFDSPVLSRK